MADINWTSQQQKAIDATGNLTVLSAAAGSGKTAVLAEKAVQMLLDENNKVAADSLLIVTFSNASAKEFKKRIEKRLNEEIKKSPDSTYIRAQKLALQKADISTIHSFCIKLTRENFEALDIAPDFTICDEAKAFALHQKAIDMAMEEGYNDPSFAKFVSIFGKSSQDKQIREFLQYMYNYFSALPFPEQKAQHLADMLKAQSFEDTEVYKYLWKNLGEQIGYLRTLSDRLGQFCLLGEVEGYRVGCMEIDKQIAMAEDAYNRGSVFIIKSIANEKRPSMGRVKKGCGNEYSEAMKVVNAEIKDVFADIAEDVEYLDSGRYYEDVSRTNEYITAITKVFVSYSKILKVIKKAEKSFEFSDFEHFALELLLDKDGNRTSLAKALQQKYVKIMEDEFQDTSYVQDMIFKTIAREGESNLFVVGDVKQSIYGFRKASPEIFLEKRSRYYNDPAAGTTIVLPNNFRSEVNVINGVNKLFNRIMTKNLGGVDYADSEQLMPAEGKTDSGETGTEIIITHGSEAQLVAEKIHNMVQSGYEIEDKNGRRPVRYGDFAILMRSKSRFSEFRDALKNYGINSFVKDEQPLLEKPEIQSIISLLKVINNPLREVYLTAGMFGDIFDFTLDDILELKKHGKKENLYKLLAQSEDEKCRDFLARLKDLSFTAKIYSPDKLIDYIVNSTGYYSRLAFSEDGGHKRENIRRFIAFAKKYISDYHNYLGDFLRYIDLLIETGKGTNENFNQPANTVAIMTMHTSKGLEFPVCFVSGLNNRFNKTDSSKKLMIDPVLGMATYSNVSFGHNRSTAGIRAISKKILNESANDEMRLLYVALTRAKNKNFITAQLKRPFSTKTLDKMLLLNGANATEYGLKQASRPIDWIIAGYADCPQIMGGLEAADSTVPALALAGVDEAELEGCKGCDINKLITFTIADVVDGQKEGAEETEDNTIAFDADKARQNLDYIYPDIAKTVLPIKVSVGEVAKAPPPVMLKKPAFVKNQTYSAAEKGTQMHLFAQHCNIAAARENLGEEINRLAEKGIVNKELLNAKQMEKFLASPVADIMVNAGKIYKEKDFLVSANARKVLGDDAFEKQEILVQGVIDCLVLNGREAIVIDYKTDRVSDMSVLYKRYGKQLDYYRFAAESLYETSSVKCIIYSFYLGEYIEF